MFVQPDPYLIISKSTRRDIKNYPMKAVLALCCTKWKPGVKAMQSSPSKAFSEVKTYTQKNRSEINPAKSAHTYGLRIYIRVILTATNRGYRGNFCSVGCLGGASSFIFTNWIAFIRLFYGVSMVLCFDTEWIFDTPLTRFPTFTHILTSIWLFWHPIWNWYIMSLWRITNCVY